jgi:hypothetical protein
MSDRNLQRYETKEAVSYYEKQSDLQACETFLFGRYLKPGRAILDQAGEGNILDPVHGGLHTYARAPETIRPQNRGGGHGACRNRQWSLSRRYL